MNALSISLICSFPSRHPNWAAKNLTDDSTTWEAAFCRQSMLVNTTLKSLPILAVSSAFVCGVFVEIQYLHIGLRCLC